MKYLILLLFSANAFSQTQELKALSAKLYDAIYHLDIDNIIAMGCSARDKTELYDLLDKSFQNEDLKLRFSLTNAKFEPSAVKTINGKQYSLINFRNVVRVTYYKKLSKADIERTQFELKRTLGAHSIKYEPQRNSFLIVYPAKFIASSDGDQWKITVADNTFLSRLFDDCIDRNVRDEFQLN